MAVNHPCMLDMATQNHTMLVNQLEKILWNLHGPCSDRYELIFINVDVCLCPIDPIKQNFAFMDCLGTLWTTKPALKVSCFEIRLNHHCLEFFYSGLLQRQNIKQYNDQPDL